MSQLYADLNILKEKLAILSEQKNNEQYEDIQKKEFRTNNPNFSLIALDKYSDQDLLQLNAKKYEESRINIISEFIKAVHRGVIKTVEYTKLTKYEGMISTLVDDIFVQYRNNSNKPSDDFYITNKIEIICNLEHLFPGCSIKYVKYPKVVDIVNNKKIYDQDKLPIHLSYFNKQQLETYTKMIDYIVVDWSKN